MKKKILFPNKFFLLASWILLILTVSIIQTGCTDKQPAPEVYKDWIRMKIKFKPNTSAESRDLTIREIQKTLADSVRAWKAAIFPEYEPNFIVTKSLTGDSLSFDIRVGDKPFPAPLKEPNANQISQYKDTINNPVCTCKTICGICLMFSKSNVGVGDPPIEYMRRGNVSSIQIGDGNEIKF